MSLRAESDSRARRSSRLQVRIICALYRTEASVRPVARASSNVSAIVASRASSCITISTLVDEYSASRRAAAARASSSLLPAAADPGALSEAPRFRDAAEAPLAGERPAEQSADGGPWSGARGGVRGARPASWATTDGGRTSRRRPSRVCTASTSEKDARLELVRICAQHRNGAAGHVLCCVCHTCFRTLSELRRKCSRWVLSQSSEVTWSSHAGSWPGSRRVPVCMKGL